MEIQKESTFFRTGHKLVAGIVVDQIRQDFLHSFYENYTANGFKKPLKEEFEFKNAHYNYA